VGGERLGLLLALEGASSFGRDPWLIDPLAALGVRMASLTWNELNAFAGGCDHDEGLTVLGEHLVDRLIEHGIIVDLAHASAQTVDDVLARTGDAAVVVSHAACRALYDHPRNLSDAQLAAVAYHGGVVGLMPHPYVVGLEQPTIERFLDHVDHAVATIGFEHVGLGGDFLPQIVRALGMQEKRLDGMRADAALEGLTGPEDYAVLVAALEARGYDPADRAALLGGNLLRLLRRGLPAA
jgi:membrane dipeptidase